VEINRELACRVEEGQVVYFNGHLPVFAHAKNSWFFFPEVQGGKGKANDIRHVTLVSIAVKS
jgi:hypothetical protein